MNQQDYDFSFQIGEQSFAINNQATIKELDEAIIAVNKALQKIDEREKEFRQVKTRIYQFMRQHHAFDLYIESSEETP